MINSKSDQQSLQNTEQTTLLSLSESNDSDNSYEVVFHHHALCTSLGLKEASDLSQFSNAADDLQLLSLPETKNCQIMIRGGSNAGGLKIQKTLAFTHTQTINQVNLYDLLFLTGMGVSTWLLRSMLKN